MKTNKTFRINNDLVELVTKEAEEKHTSLAWVIEEALMLYFKKDTHKTSPKIDSKEKVESVFIQEEIKAPTPKEIEPDISKPLIDDPEYNAMPESNFAEAKAKRMTSIRRHGMDNPAAVQERARLFNLFK